MSTPSALHSLSNDLASAVERASASIVSVNGRNRLPSTGVVWRSGVVVTAESTVERDDEITVTLHDGTTLPATLAGRDPSTDLAVLKVDGLTLAPATIGDSADLKVGQLVLAIGRPGEGGVSASFGALSAVSGAWRTSRGGQIDRFVRADVTLYPGFSGGPLVDAQGQVVGINTSHLTRSVNVAVPSATVTRVAEQLLATGRIARGYLGLGMQPVRITDNTRAALNISNTVGLIVIQIEQGGPAEKGGALIGDMLIALDGKPLSDIDDVQALLGPDRVGQPVTAQVIRGGALTTLTLTVGERPSGK